MSLSGPLRGSFYSVFWHPRIPVSLSSVKDFGIIQVVHWVWPHSTEFWKQQLITNSEFVFVSVLGMKKFMGVSMWSTTTCRSLSEPLPTWVGVRTWNLPFRVLTYTFYSCTLHFFLIHSLARASCSNLSNDFEFKVLFLCRGNVMTQKQDGMSHINLRTYLIWILFQCNQVVGYITYKSSLCFQLILLFIKIQFLFLLFLFIIISRHHIKITHN